MFKVNVIAVGKLKENYLKEASWEYEKRLSRFCKLEIKEIGESTPKREAESILSSMKGYTFALAIEGESVSSEEFAKKLKLLSDRGSEVSFLIGSSLGLDDSVKQKADELLSFSKMTFPHQLMRVFLLEQIYRAFMINSNAPYHK